MSNINGVVSSPVDERVHVFENICNGVLPDKFMLVTEPSVSQGYTSWCVGFASANMTSCDARVKHNEKKRFSPGYLMKHAKDIDNCTSQKGTTLEAACKVLVNKGICEYDLYPFMGSSEEVNNNFSPISQEAVENAKRYKADSYARCSGVDGIKQAIYNSNGALIALNVFGNYDTDERALIGLPGQFDKVKGRHCLFACGWDDDMEVETTHGTYKGFLILQESDRLNTSANGFRFLPYEAFTKYNSYGDRTFFEAWCTYESKLAEPNYHKDAAVSIPDIKRKHAYIQIGSRELKMDTKTIVMAVAPIVIDGTTLLPLRYLGEVLGITVTWNAETKTVKAYDKEQGILRYFKVNTNTACDSEGNVVLTGIADTQIINGRTMLPVRLFAESFNCIVDYVKETKTIVISK